LFGGEGLEALLQLNRDAAQQEEMGQIGTSPEISRYGCVFSWEY
jgi:hypothetical protein